MLSKIKTYGLIALSLITAVLYGLLSGAKSKLARRDKEDAEAQRDTLVRAQENIETASREGKENAKDAIDRSDRGDWSGLN